MKQEKSKRKIHSKPNFSHQHTTATKVNKTIKPKRRKRRNLKLKRQLRTNMRITQLFNKVVDCEILDKVDSEYVQSEFSNSQKSNFFQN